MSHNSVGIEVVTIDGPSGVGKSTISRQIAAVLQFSYLDTGAMYRAVGLYLKDKGVDWNNEGALAEQLARIEITLLPAPSPSADTGVIINGVDLSLRIRDPEAGMIASDVSAIGLVRTKLTELQRALGEQGRIVAEGRDMGTVVFPRAKFKFYLDADPEVRAMRRYKQLLAKGDNAAYQEILEQTIIRDRNDSQREIAPLKRADDAYLIDTGKLTIDGVVATVLEQMQARQS